MNAGHRPLSSPEDASGVQEVVFEHVKGVTDVVSGYAGGSKESAKYELVSGGGTQHAESIQIK